METLIINPNDRHQVLYLHSSNMVYDILYFICIEEAWNRKLSKVSNELKPRISLANITLPKYMFSKHIVAVYFTQKK